MRSGASLADAFGRMVPAAAEALRDERPAYVLVHGDTLTTMAVALAAFFEGLPVAHVEAGLRSFDLAEPFPEEASRRSPTSSPISTCRRPPLAREHLLREGKDADAHGGDRQHRDRRRALGGAPRGLPAHVPRGRPLVAVTLHRRENLPAAARPGAGAGGRRARQSRAHFVYPMHRNPRVREAVVPVLSGLANVPARGRLGLPGDARVAARGVLVVTDSGGLQEEGAALGTPVAVVRNVTERPEGVSRGHAAAARQRPERVRAGAAALLRDEAAARRACARREPVRRRPGG
jgi:UDP-N-acetylglucosamine 2-epimerase (non-hydrolysing)